MVTSTSVAVARGVGVSTGPVRVGAKPGDAASMDSGTDSATPKPIARIEVRIIPTPEVVRSTFAYPFEYGSKGRVPVFKGVVVHELQHPAT